MTDNKNSTDVCEAQPPSLGVIREIFGEFNIPDVSDELCTRVLDVLYRHTCDVIEESKAMAHHVGRTKIEESDLRLAINSINEELLFSPPYKDQLLNYSEKNEQPLPSIRSSCGIRLPADRFNLTAPNYSFLPPNGNDKMNNVSELSSGDSSLNLHITPYGNAARRMFRTVPVSTRPMNVNNPIGASSSPSVHVIAPTGINPSMIRVQTVQQLSANENTSSSISSLRALPVGTAVSNMTTFRSFTKNLSQVKGERSLVKNRNVVNKSINH